jgi:hypothetical protein
VRQPTSEPNATGSSWYGRTGRCLAEARNLAADLLTCQYPPGVLTFGVPFRHWRPVKT